MRDRQLRQAGRPVGSTWLPAQYTGELEESFSVAQATDDPECEVKIDGDEGMYDAVGEGRHMLTGSVADAVACSRANRSGYLRPGESCVEEDRGEGSSKLASLDDGRARGKHVRKASGTDLHLKGSKGNQFDLSDVEDEENEALDNGSPFSITSIAFADPPYSPDENTVEFHAQVADDARQLDVRGDSLTSTTSSFQRQATRASFWDGIRRTLDRRRLGRGSAEALTQLPSPLPRTSIELQPLPSFA